MVWFSSRRLLYRHRRQIQKTSLIVEKMTLYLSLCSNFEKDIQRNHCHFLCLHTIFFWFYKCAILFRGCVNREKNGNNMFIKMEKFLLLEQKMERPTTEINYTDFKSEYSHASFSPDSIHFEYLPNIYEWRYILFSPVARTRFWWTVHFSSILPFSHRGRFLFSLQFEFS